MTSLQSLGEFGLIAAIRERMSVRSHAIRQSIGDDAAVLQIPDSHEAVITKDMLIENVHFRRDWTSASDLGWKSLAVNLSDIAAMGATPLAAFVALGLPRHIEAEWTLEFYDGIEKLAGEFAVTIAGGDTTASTHDIVICVTVVGSIPNGSALRRDAARPQDAVVVTGMLGNAATGLELLRRKELIVSEPQSRQMIETHLRPFPRLREVDAAMQAGDIHACIDLSDGLAGDAHRIAEASNVRIELDEELMPVSKECRTICERIGKAPVEMALFGGEDYELLLTVAESDSQRVIDAINHSGTHASRIGTVTSGPAGVYLRQIRGGLRALRGSFEHFTEEQKGE